MKVKQSKSGKVMLMGGSSRLGRKEEIAKFAKKMRVRQNKGSWKLGRKEEIAKYSKKDGSESRKNGVYS